MLKNNVKIMNASIAIALLSVFTVQSHAGAPLSNSSKDNSVIATKSAEISEKDAAHEAVKKAMKSWEATQKALQKSAPQRKAEYEKRTAVVQSALNAYIAEYDTYAKTRDAELKAYAVATPSQQVTLEEKRLFRERQIAERIARKIYPTATEDIQLEKKRVDIVQQIGEIYIAEVYADQATREDRLKKYATATLEEKDDFDQDSYEDEIQRIKSITRIIYYEGGCGWMISCASVAEYSSAPLFKKIQLEKEMGVEKKKLHAEDPELYGFLKDRSPVFKARAVEKYAELEIRKVEQAKYDAATPKEKLRIDKERLDREKEDRVGEGHTRIQQKVSSSYCKENKICIANQKAYAAASFSQKLQMEKNRRLLERERLKQTL